MKRLINLLPLIVVLLGLLIIFCSIRDYINKAEGMNPSKHSQVNEEPDMPVTEGMGSADKRIIQSAFDNPEVLDGQLARNVSVQSRLALLNRPALMGSKLEDLNTRGEYLESDVCKSIPLVAKHFSSLRQDGVSNPSSSANKASKKIMVKNRQKRSR